MPLLLRASTLNDMLAIFEKERERYGWATAKDTINRIAKNKAVQRGGSAATAALNADPRFLALLDVPATALRQGVMCSKVRLNYQTDDLTSIQRAIKLLRVPAVHPLHDLLHTKIEEERQEDDEPGEHGHDFQGGSMGF